mgnify:CR=1 FL=1
MMNRSRRLDDIQPFHVMELLRRARELEAQGRDIIHMEVGEPDFATPQPVIDAATRFLASGDVHYTPALGLPALREAIARFYQDRFKADVAPERIIVTAGASAALHGEIAEMLSLDISIAAPGQNTSEHAATICMQDMSGPFDYHLTHKLIALAREHGIAHRRDIFRYYRSDSAAAVEAGNDIRTALVGFGADASHAQERTHRDALEALTKLVIAYMTSEPVARRDCRSLGSLDGFTEQLCPADMTVPSTPLPEPDSFLARYG